jgi:hypothetical protein
MLKFYNPEKKSAVLNRNNFSLLRSAAFAVAQVEVASMKYYRGGNQEIIGVTMAIIILQYLSF